MSDTRAGQRFLLLLLVGAGTLTFFVLWPFFAPLVFAVVFAVVLQPVYRRFARLLGSWRSTAALITVLVAAVCVLVPLGLLGTHLAQQAQQVYATFVEGNGQTQVRSMVLYVEETVVRYVPEAQGFSDALSVNISSYSRQGLQWAIERIGPVFSGVASLALSLFVFLITLYYLLRDGDKFKRAAIELSPLSDVHDETVLNRLGQAVNSVITGSLLVGLIQGTLTAVGFAIFGVPNSILWGTVAAVAALVPGVGTSLVFIPAVIFLLVTGSGGAALGLAAWGAVAVGTIDNLLGPRLMGRGINLHPVFVLLSVLGGLSFFGIMGLFLGPILLSFLSALLSIYATMNKEA